MVGETLAHYRLLEKLGSGGMGVVYAADDTILNRRVALKVLSAPVAQAGESRTRFTREAKALAALPGTLFYVSNRGGSMDLWRQRLSADGTPAGEPVAVTAGVGMQQAAFSRDGRKLAYSKGQIVANVWRVPVLEDREATWQDAEQLTFDHAYIGAFDLFPDGERLVVSSDRGGNLDLWKVEIPGNRTTQLTNDPGPDWSPTVSPNGQRIAFHSYRGGNRDLWVMPADGGPAVQVTHDEANDMAPAWSPDGNELAFHSTREDFSNVWVVPAAGGSPRQATHSPEAAYTPDWSPDGTWIAYMSRQRLWRVPASGGTGTMLSDKLATGTFRWSRDELLYCVGAVGDEPRDIWVLTPASGVVRRVTRLSRRDGTFGGGLAVGPEHVYFTWRTNLGDVWVADMVTDRTVPLTAES